MGRQSAGLVMNGCSGRLLLRDFPVSGKKPFSKHLTKTGFPLVPSSYGHEAKHGVPSTMPNSEQMNDSPGFSRSLSCIASLGTPHDFARIRTGVCGGPSVGILFEVIVTP